MAKPLAERWIMVVLLAVALGVHLWGVRRNLPFTAEVDEPVFVTRALMIAASGYLNPGWFGHPGSTIMYPLAAADQLWNAAAHGGLLLHPNSELEGRFYSNPSEFYLLGRLLAVAYALLGVMVIYLMGRRAFGRRAALIGSMFWIFYPIAVAYAQMVRTDSAAVFFGVLALWLCLRLYDQPTIQNQVIAGLAIGLGFATRYFLVSLIPVLLITDALILWKDKSRAARLKYLWPGMFLGVLAIIAAFAVSTPYFFRDFATALKDLKGEAETTHLGADGLGYAGNMLWYLTRAIPVSVSWPQMILAVAGLALIVHRRKPEHLLLVVFVVTFLTGISLSHLHWQRWIIQILPLFALMAAYGLDETIALFVTRFRMSLSSQRGLLLFAVLLVAALPAYKVASYDTRGTGSSSRLLARHWILEHLPPGSHIAQDRYSAPLVNDDFFGHPPERYSGPLPGNEFVIYERYSLAPDRTPDDYYREGYRYLVVSSAMYERYLAEPARYASEVSFYQAVFRDEQLLQRFGSAAAREGFENTEGHLLQPDVQIYQLRER